MRVLLALFLGIGLVSALDTGEYLDEDTDAIIVEVAAADAAEGGDDDDDGDDDGATILKNDDGATILKNVRQARQFFHLRQQVLPQQTPVIVPAGAPVAPPPGSVPPGLAPVVRPAENQPCITKSGSQGRCSSLKQCYPYFKLFELQPEDTWVMGSYDTCSYYTREGRQIFGVCCPPPKPPGSPIPEPPTEEDYEDDEEDDEGAEVGGHPIDFQEINTQCGQRNAWRNDFRIINGVVASVNEFPFMAALLNRKRQFCGGSLIDDIHILTAAHCVAHMSKYDVQNLRVVLGDHNLKQSGETRGDVAEHSVKRVIRHKKFDSTSLWFDVALLTLDRPVKRRANIQPVCLADTSNNFEGQTVEVAGWGTTVAGGGSSSSILRKVDVRVWSNQKCSRSYGDNAPGGITDHMMCASKPSSKKDSCSGDSGGPLFHCASQNGGCEQVGIVSWGIGCAREEYPGVYTRVTSLLKWIKRIAKKY